jgi:hypothetical protein
MSGALLILSVYIQLSLKLLQLPLAVFEIWYEKKSRAHSEEPCCLNLSQKVVFLMEPIGSEQDTTNSHECARLTLVSE